MRATRLDGGIPSQPRSRHARRPRPMPLSPPRRRSRLTASSAASFARTTCGSRSSIAGSAIRDLHTVRSEWPGTVYPCVPGHEIVGRVDRGRAGGDAGSRKATWPRSAAWSIAAGLRRLPGGARAILRDRPHRHLQQPGPGHRREHAGRLFGHRSWCARSSCSKIRHDEKDLAAAAPLLCAGITTWSPLRHWKVGPGSQGRRGRHRRARPYGDQARQGARRACRRLHHLARTRRRTRRRSARTRSWSRGTATR